MSPAHCQRVYTRDDLHPRFLLTRIARAEVSDRGHLPDSTVGPHPRATAFMRPLGRCMTGQLLRAANWRGSDPVPNNTARLRQNAAELVLWARLRAGAKLYLVAIE